MNRKKKKWLKLIKFKKGDYIMIICDLNTKREKRDLLRIEKMKLDRFFSMYLDKFGDKMDSDKPNTTIWSLYKAKMKEYGEISQEIRRLDYWIENNV